MDPMTIAVQLLQEAQQTIATQCEEIQLLRNQLSSNDNGDKMQKKASATNLAIITGFKESDLPDFVKSASEEELHNFMDMIDARARYNAIGKIAEITDGSYGTPEETLEDRLSNIIGA